MHEVALYRKYRPKNFKEVSGQDEVVRVLEGAIKQEKIGHAYIFSGPRGTGKTSVARIFAEAIGTTGNDLYEIDAASNTGVDNIRDLREAINTLPFESPYKVYLIDEVHMLSKGAFNALLKTLEEPPKHAIFILATTEFHKIPETVVSRCQVFSFKKPSLSLLKEMIIDLAKREGFTLESASADLVALLSEGSFRDAQVILQKILSSAKAKKISSEEVEAITGAPKASLVNQYLQALGSGEVEPGLQALTEAEKQNLDIKVYGKLLLRKARAVLILKTAPGMAKNLESEFSDSDFAFLKELSANKNSRINSPALIEILTAVDLVGYASTQTLPLELALIKLTNNK
ncbi:MAG: DNA polymerase III subunit gamma/tau [Candidatus Paceibacterota bacterium]